MQILPMAEGRGLELHAQRKLRRIRREVNIMKEMQRVANYAQETKRRLGRYLHEAFIGLSIEEFVQHLEQEGIKSVSLTPAEETIFLRSDITYIPLVLNSVNYLTLYASYDSQGKMKKTCRQLNISHRGRVLEDERCSYLDQNKAFTDQQAAALHGMVPTVEIRVKEPIVYDQKI